ncbi:MAG TPA: hypothetical protein VLR89_02720, partial [Anaerolineaceae bacterium]|nr:hypothetical protein [Anaerolineaceae bacterium]
SSSAEGPQSPSQNLINNPPSSGQTSNSAASEPTAAIKVIAPTATKRAAPTATSEPAPTATKKPAPTPTKNPCPGSMPLRFKKGDTVLVDTNPDRLIVRWDGDVNANEVVRICFDSVVKIVDGPKCSDNSNWWYIEAPAGTMTSNCAQGNGSRLNNSVNGWVREGGIDFRDGTNHYFLVPLR